MEVLIGCIQIPSLGEAVEASRLLVGGGNPSPFREFHAESVHDTSLAFLAQTILTPKRERDQMMRNRSLSCTPSSYVHRSDSEPAKHQLSFVKTNSADSEHPTPTTAAQYSSPVLKSTPTTVPLSAKSRPDTHHPSSAASVTTPHAKKPRLSKVRTLYDVNSNDDEKANISLIEEEEEEEELDEFNIQGALTDELKILQDRNRNLQQQLEGVEKRAGHLTRSKGELEAQVQEISQVRG
jgi:hypothetical protein